jgi:hypothetical protein
MVAEHNIIKQNETTKAIPFPHLSPEKKTRSQPPSETLVSPGGRGIQDRSLGTGENHESMSFSQDMTESLKL